MHEDAGRTGPSRATVGAVQLVAVRGDKAANLDAIEELGAAAAAAGALVVVAPEMAVTGYCWPDEAEVRALAEPLDGPVVHRLTRLAHGTGAWFVVGLPELSGDGLLYNSCVLVGPDGLLGVYRKTHPFLADPFWAVDGDRLPPVWETPAGRVAPLICADLDHPEPARYAALAGAGWLAVPTAWVDEPGPSATWRLRAWENAMPVVAADMAGHELGIQFSGGSAVIEHDGAVVAALDAGAGHVTGTLDLAAGARRRAALLSGRRPAEYRPLALSSRWPRGGHDGPFTPTHEAAAVGVAVLAAAPGEVPPLDAPAGLAVLPAFHLCGGVPAGEAAARTAAARWAEALDRLVALAREHRCEVVTTLVEPGRHDALHVSVVAVDGSGVTAHRRTTHLGPHSSWAVPGEPLAPARARARLGPAGPARRRRARGLRAVPRAGRPGRRRARRPRVAPVAVAGPLRRDGRPPGPGAGGAGSLLRPSGPAAGR